MSPPLAQQRPETPWASLVPATRGSPDGRVLHLATHLDRGVLDLLGPATAALARSGNPQTVVLIDHVDERALLPLLDENTELVLVPRRRNPLAQWRALSTAFAHAMLAQRPETVHLHGLIAGLLGERVLAGLQSRTPALHSQGGGGVRTALLPLAMLARLLGRSGRGSATARALCHGQADAQWLQARGHPSVAVVEGPVDRAYFVVTPHAARHPLVVSASRSGDVRAAEAFDQLAVLLGGDALGLGFNWIGPLDAVSAARLKAAAVGVFDSAEPAERATRLAAGWIFVALSSESGFPLCLAEAMAAGLPCVALDTPAHRGLVHQGETGYLCRSQAEVIDRIAQLADTPSLRERMGRAGRDLARERFCQARFEHTLFAAYAAASGAGAAAEKPLRVRQDGLGLKEIR